MLLRFGMQNIRSIRERQELSLVATPLTDHHEGLIAYEAVPGFKNYCRPR